jgi:hypothetical protein
MTGLRCVPRVNCPHAVFIMTKRLSHVSHRVDNFTPKVRTEIVRQVLRAGMSLRTKKGWESISEVLFTCYNAQLASCMNIVSLSSTELPYMDEISFICRR